MENKHPEHFWSEFIPCIYDVEHYKHFFRNHNNLVIPKKRKKIQKQKFFLSSLQKFLQLKKYSRWKINIQSIINQHKILYQKIKKNLFFEIL